MSQFVLVWKTMDLLHSLLKSTYCLIHHTTVQVSSNKNALFMSYDMTSFTAIDEDFQPSSTVLTFEPMNPDSCISVTLTDSVDLEMSESFFVTLQKPDDLDERISINTNKDEMEVEIIDDDSECAKAVLP